MKSVLSTFVGVAVAILMSGCARDIAEMKLASSGRDPEVKLRDNISYATNGRLQPYNDEWKNVKSQVHKPKTANQPYTAMITVEIYNFDSPTSTVPSVRSDYEISLTHRGSQWVITELKVNSGPIGREKWYSKNGMTALSSKDARWKVIARELELAP